MNDFRQDAPWPVEIRLKKSEKCLSVAFDNGERFELPAEYLRVESPSAEGSGPRPGTEDHRRGQAACRHHGCRDGRQLCRAPEV